MNAIEKIAFDSQLYSSNNIFVTHSLTIQTICSSHPLRDEEITYQMTSSTDRVHCTATRYIEEELVTEPA